MLFGWIQGMQQQQQQRLQLQQDRQSSGFQEIQTVERIVLVR